jgi:hypothetical protein
MSKPTSQCHICSKSFINLKSHITKSHWTPVAKPVAEPVAEPVAVPVAMPAISFVEELDSNSDSESESVAESVAEEKAEEKEEEKAEEVKPTLYGTPKIRFTFQDVMNLVKEMPSDKYKMMNGVYLEAVLEQKVLDAVGTKPRTAKDILKAIKGEFPTTNKQDINRILYKNNKKLKRVETGEKSAPLWSK